VGQPAGGADQGVQPGTLGVRQHHNVSFAYPRPPTAVGIQEPHEDEGAPLSQLKVDELLGGIDNLLSVDPDSSSA